MNPTLQAIIDKAVAMFYDGKSLKEIKGFLEAQMPEASKSLRQEVADALGISIDEFTFETGSSFNMTRFQRPRNTYGRMIAAIVAAFAAMRKKVRQIKGSDDPFELAINQLRLEKKYSKKWNNAKSKKAKDKVMEDAIADLLGRVVDRNVYDAQRIHFEIVCRHRRTPRT